MLSLGLLSSFISESSVSSPLQWREMGNMERPAVQRGGGIAPPCSGSAMGWQRNGKGLGQPLTDEWHSLKLYR